MRCGCVFGIGHPDSRGVTKFSFGCGSMARKPDVMEPLARSCGSDRPSIHSPGEGVRVIRVSGETTWLLVTLTP